MESIFRQFTDWMKEMLVSGIMDSLTSMFDELNSKVGDVATQVGTSPASFSPGIFSMIQNISETVIMPIAGIILTFIACYELIQLVISHNNLANFETWIFFKWIFKTFVAVELITNTFTITMAVFDVAQHVITQSGGIIAGSTAIDASTLATMQTTLEAMDVMPLFAVFLQTFIVRTLTQILGIIIFVIVYGRMIEIYLMVSMAPIPFATFGNREQSMMGQTYLRSLFALGFQGFLIMICVGIYAVLIQSITFSSDIVASLWGIVGYTVLLAFTLFKTGALAKSILHAH
ncbi:MAG TPA: CD0415/CD1112 family protein [Lachnospiraceae bacterium]|nr:CD0415/CD1112 family protein [Lachnospiraceae bacterium]